MIRMYIRVTLEKIGVKNTGRGEIQMFVPTSGAFQLPTPHSSSRAKKVNCTHISRDRGTGLHSRASNLNVQLGCIKFGRWPKCRTNIFDSTNLSRFLMSMSNSWSRSFTALTFRMTSTRVQRNTTISSSSSSVSFSRPMRSARIKWSGGVNIFRMNEKQNRYKRTRARIGCLLFWWKIIVPKLKL